MSEEERRDDERRESQVFRPDPTDDPPYQPQPTHQRYEVKEGDSLESIAEDFYDDTTHWRRIFDANRDILDEPEDIYPGQELKIPEMR